MSDIRNKLNMLQVLPGLYLSRDSIQKQIDVVEQALGIAPKRLGRPRKEEVLLLENEPPPEVCLPKQEESENSRKKYWAGLSVEQKAARVDGMKAGRRRAARNRARQQRLEAGAA